MRRGFVAGAAAVVLLTLAGCGFRPLYFERAEMPEVTAELALIDIRPIAERVGQEVRNNLLDLVTPLGEPARARYILTVDLVESRQGLALQRDATVTRYNLTVNAEFHLLDAATRAEVNSGSVRSTAAFNVLRADFANVIAERDAEERAARVVAEEIATRLSVFFARTIR